MENKRIDRRVKYTKMVIKDSFIKFLQDKPISKITVKEICEEADINRATFYSHYQDQYDLLRQIEDEIIYDINQYLEVYDCKDDRLIPVELIEKILDYVDKNAELLNIFLNLNGDLTFQQKLIKQTGIQNILPILGCNMIDKGMTGYVYQFLACGAIGIIQLWLKEGRQKSSRELAELLLKISHNGRTSFS